MKKWPWIAGGCAILALIGVVVAAAVGFYFYKHHRRGYVPSSYSTGNVMAPDNTLVAGPTNTLAPVAAPTPASGGGGEAGRWTDVVTLTDRTTQDSVNAAANLVNFAYNHANWAGMAQAMSEVTPTTEADVARDYAPTREQTGQVVEMNERALYAGYLDGNRTLQATYQTRFERTTEYEQFTFRVTNGALHFVDVVISPNSPD